MSTIKKMNLVSALVVRQGEQVLISSRPTGKEMAGLWEFPGGKIEYLETAEDALVREIKEELNITVLAKDLTPLQFVSHRYKDSYLLMVVYITTQWSGIITPMEGQAVKWIDISQLQYVDMPLADVPLVEILEKQFVR